MRRRYLHSGMAAAAGADAFGMDEDLWEEDLFGEDPFIDHNLIETFEGMYILGVSTRIFSVKHVFMPVGVFFP